MKKLFTLALTALMLLSCFTVTTSAADGVNVFSADKGAQYAYVEDITSAFKAGNEDTNYELLNDGIIPDMETPFESVIIQGTNKIVEIVIDLGKVYEDITSINFLCVCDSYTDGTSGKNRGFSGEKTIFKFSEDGLTFTRNKDFEMERVKMDPDSAESYYNFNFKFDNVTAKAISLTIYSPVYILSLGEIEVISASGEGKEIVVEESSEEEIIEESEEEPVDPESEAEEESEEASEAESEAETESEAASEAASEEASKAEESKTESKAEESKAEEEGGNGLVIVIVVVAVVAVGAVVAVVLLKKKK